ncbi:SCO family protein [Streptomyces sp. NPDC002537]
MNGTAYRTSTALAAAACCWALLSGCGSQDTAAGDAPVAPAPTALPSTPASRTGYQGTVLPRPFDKPDMKLTDTGGEAYDFAARTAGKVTLLYFGYTHCPDVCPTTLADIALAKRKLPEDQQRNLNVVFVSTDPDRDKPDELRKWLDSFDKSFVGLRGSIKDVIRAAGTVGVPIEAPKVDKNGDVEVEHGARVIAFGADGKARLSYTISAGPETFQHDLPLLMKGTPAR